MMQLPFTVATHVNLLIKESNAVIPAQAGIQQVKPLVV